MTVLEARHASYADGGQTHPVLAWALPSGAVAISSAVLGGGIGPRAWVVNAQVDLEYHHTRPDAHVAEIAAGLGLVEGSGIGLLTAANVSEVTTASDGGAECAATVGVSVPTWAAAPDGSWSRWRPGTINLVCWVPAPLGEAALVNAVVTATEAKSQALFEADIPGTGTASDAVVVCCPPGGTERYAGPRSPWGGRLGRAVHAAVRDGLRSFATRAG